MAASPSAVRLSWSVEDVGGRPRVSGEEQQQVLLEVGQRLGWRSQAATTFTLSSGRNSKQVMPPKAAMYWSCLPIGSPQQVDLDMAGLLGQFAR